MENHALKYCDDCLEMLRKITEKQQRGVDCVEQIRRLKEAKMDAEDKNENSNILEEKYTKLLAVSEYIKGAGA